jgi:hypothetical protein
MIEPINIMSWDDLAKNIESPAIIVSACRRSGKTFLTRDQLYQINKHQKFDVVFLFCETGDYNKDFEYIPPRFKYNEYNENTLGEIIKKQEKCMIQCNKDGTTPPKVLIIFDDVASTTALFYSPNINKLFTLGRHINMSVIYLTQHISSISPKQRKNADVICAFKDPNRDNKKTLINQFMSIDSEKQGEEIYNLCFTEPYMCICICVYKVQQSKSLHEFICRYKSPETKPKFKLADKSLWGGHQIETSNKSEDKDKNKKYSKGVKVDTKIIEASFKKQKKNDQPSKYIC